MLNQTRSITRRAKRAWTLTLSLGLVAVSLGAVTASTAATALKAAGSVNQVYVTGLDPSEQASLYTAGDTVVATRTATALGGMLFRDVPAGSGYYVKTAGGDRSDDVTVHDADAAPWDSEIYGQPIAPGGYQYLKTRDGTELAIYVHPPTSPAGEPGIPSDTPLPNGPDYLPPYPTLIEYSGYGYANPAGPESGIAVLANLMGFAVVDVNMRGTGCSGGAYDFFETLQNLDGYDVVETIASQPWVLGNKVGMLGISYGGISQLFTAQLQPPHLAAITPLSVIDTTATTLYPGGVLNTGFAVAWSDERQQQAQAAPNGQAWANTQIANGDATCLDNQVLHGEAADLHAKIDANDHYNAAVADPLDPITFVNKINVPVFMACQFEDEQTGGHCPELVKHFTGTDKKWFTFTNGAHIDSLDPETYNKWYDFMELYVAHQAPIVNQGLVRAIAPVVYNQAAGIDPPAIDTLPLDPIQTIPTYDGARAAFEAQPSVRILFDNGAGASPTGQKTPGDPYPAFEQSFSTLPADGTVARTWYVDAGGTLSDAVPSAPVSSSFVADAHATNLTNFTGATDGGGLWSNAAKWKWSWQQNKPGTAVSYESAPLSENTTVIGAGSVSLWLKASTPDVDLQATITEVRPDGQETFVQDGWIRASERALSTDADNIFKQPSTILDPIPTFLASDAQDLPSDGSYTKVVVPLYWEGHAYRAGSKIRVIIAAPNGAQPVWSFGQTRPADATSTVSILSSATQPSELTLPVVPGVAVPAPLPPCPSLRNEPCRKYMALTNG